MAQLTDYINSPSGAKPVIPTQIAVPDIFGAVEGAVQAYTANKTKQATAERQAASEQRAVEDHEYKVNQRAAESEIAAAMFSFSTGTTVDTLPSDIQTQLAKIDKLRKGGALPVQIEAEKSQLISSVLRKYEDQSQNILSTLGSMGFDHGVARWYSEEQKALDNQFTRQQAELDSAYTYVSGKGILTNNLTQDQVLSTASRLRLEDAAFEREKAEWELLKSKKENARAEASHLSAQEERDLTAASRRYGQEIWRTSMQNTTGIMQGLSEARMNAGTDAEKNKALVDLISNDVLPALMREDARLTAMAAEAGLNKADQEALRANQNARREFVESIINGDASYQKHMGTMIDIMTKEAVQYSWEAAPLLNKLQAVIPPQILSPWMEQFGRELPLFSSGQGSQLYDELMNLLSDNGGPTGEITSALNTLETSTPASIRAASPQDFTSTLKLSVSMMPTAANALIEEPTRESAQSYSKLISPLLVAGAQVSPTTSGTDHMNNVAASLGTEANIEAIKAIKAVDPALYEKVSKTTSATYLVALRGAQQALLNENTQSFVDPSGASRITVAPVRFDPMTGNFYGGTLTNNGRVQEYPANTKALTNMNKLLDAAYELEKDLGNIPAGMTPVQAKAFLVNGLNTLQDIQVYADVNGWSSASPLQIMQGQQTTEPQQAGENTQVVDKFGLGIKELEAQALQFVDE